MGRCHSADIYGRSHVVDSGETQNTFCTVAPDKASPQCCGEPTTAQPGRETEMHREVLHLVIGEKPL